MTTTYVLRTDPRFTVVESLANGTYNWEPVSNERVQVGEGDITVTQKAYSENDLNLRFARWSKDENGNMSCFWTEFNMYYRSKYIGQDPSWEYSSASRRGDLRMLADSIELLTVASYFVTCGDHTKLMEEYWKQVESSPVESLDD